MPEHDFVLFLLGAFSGAAATAFLERVVFPLAIPLAYRRQRH